jgi:hypothetical protein
MQVALKLVRKELELLDASKLLPLVNEELSVTSATATELEKEESAEKTTSNVVISEVI